MTRPLLLYIVLTAAAYAQPVPDTLRPPTDDLVVYGWTVDADAGRLLVGAWESRTTAAYAALSDPTGTAFVYRLGDGPPVLEGRLVADRIGREDCFSWSLDIRGDFAVVGAECEEAGDGRGSVYVYHFDGTAWVREDRLTAVDVSGPLVPSFRLGESVALGDGYLVAGAGYTTNPSGPDGDDASGGAFVFERQGGVWTHTATLVNDDADVQLDEYFGGSVAVVADTSAAETVVIGAPAESAPGARARGALYVFQRAGGVWTQQAKVLCPGQRLNEHCGDLLDAGGGGGALVGSWSRAFLLEATAGGWEIGPPLVADTSFAPWAIARWGPTAVAVGSNGTYTGHLFTKQEGAWTGTPLPLQPIFQWRDELVSANGRHAYVGRPYLGASESQYVLVYPLPAATAAEPGAPPGLDLGLTLAPNPASGSVRVRLVLSASATALRLTVHDVLGRLVAQRVLPVSAAGAQEATLDLRGLRPGTYVVRAEAEGASATRRLVLR